MLKVGAVIAERYQLGDSIAAGGVGQVWRATDLVLQRRVAVKLLRPEYADHPETLQRFRAEARHAGSLTHPCIAQVYDFGHIAPSGQPFLVMELVDGPSLADVLAVEPVGTAYALDVISKVASGLAAAHRAGVVHRDVKPGNILLGPEGHVKITDFGIAHAVGSAPVTDPGMVMGTVQYLAPERIAGAPASPGSDLYSLGIVLHECLTAMPPFKGTPAEVMAAHLYLPLPPLPPDVPPEAGELVMRLTAKDPSARLSSADDAAGIAGRLSADLAAGETTASPQGEAPVVSRVRGLLATLTGAAAADAAGQDFAAADPARPERAGPVYASPLYEGLEPAAPGTAGTRAPVLASAGLYTEDVQAERLGLRRRHRRGTDPRRPGGPRSGRPRSARKAGAVTAGAVVLVAGGLGGWLAVAGAKVSPPAAGTAHHAASRGSPGTAGHSQIPQPRASTSPARASTSPASAGERSASRSPARPTSSPSPEPGPGTSAPGGSGGSQPSPAPSSSGGGGLLPSLPLPSLPIIGGLGL